MHPAAPQGMPFCVAGMGDLLALFRCISCRFAFGSNVARPTTLGAPGRVYTSSEVGAGAGVALCGWGAAVTGTGARRWGRSGEGTSAGSSSSSARAAGRLCLPPSPLARLALCATLRPQPEMCCNVQQYGKQQYLRKAEAQQCQVQSTLLLPLFISRTRSGCVGVLEVVQTSQDMAFADVAELLAVALEVRSRRRGQGSADRMRRRATRSVCRTCRPARTHSTAPRPAPAALRPVHMWPGGDQAPRPLCQHHCHGAAAAGGGCARGGGQPPGAHL